jgi:hypothetical protein
MNYNGYRRGTRNGQGRRNGGNRIGQTYVWRLSWYDCRSSKKKSRAFTSKTQALMLKAKLDADYNTIAVYLEKWEG